MVEFLGFSCPVLRLLLEVRHDACCADYTHDNLSARGCELTQHVVLQKDSPVIHTAPAVLLEKAALDAYPYSGPGKVFSGSFASACLLEACSSS